MSFDLHLCNSTLKDSKSLYVEEGVGEASTYTLGGGDVHVAADEGQPVVHAHLQINHPERKHVQSQKCLHVGMQQQARPQTLI